MAVNNNTLILKVTDNGMGMDPNHKEGLFAMFKRYYTNIKEAGMG